MKLKHIAISFLLVGLGSLPPSAPQKETPFIRLSECRLSPEGQSRLETAANDFFPPEPSKRFERPLPDFPCQCGRSGAAPPKRSFAIRAAFCPAQVLELPTELTLASPEALRNAGFATKAPLARAEFTAGTRKPFIES